MKKIQIVLAMLAAFLLASCSNMADDESEWYESWPSGMIVYYTNSYHSALDYTKYAETNERLTNMAKTGSNMKYDRECYTEASTRLFFEFGSPCSRTFIKAELSTYAPEGVYYYKVFAVGAADNEKRAVWLEFTIDATNPNDVAYNTNVIEKHTESAYTGTGLEGMLNKLEGYGWWLRDINDPEVMPQVVATVAYTWTGREFVRAN